jgi:hypothetical protein
MKLLKLNLQICDPDGILTSEDRMAANEELEHLQNDTFYSLGTDCQRQGWGMTI